MTKDKWLNIVDMVDNKFGINTEKKETITDEISGNMHIIEFNGPLGKMRLVWTERPRLKDVKTIYSDRIGSGVTVNKIYDKEEKVSYMNAYKWNESKSDWEEIENSMFEN